MISGRETGRGQLEKEKRIHLIYLASAVLIAAAVIYAGFLHVDAGMTKGYDVVALGDSILGKARGSENIQNVIEEVSGLTMYNGAFGGNTAGAWEEDYRYSFHDRSLNLWKLTEAVCRKDFGEQLADLAASQVKVWYFDEVMQGLTEIDFTQVRMLLLEFGTNDYAFGIPLDNQEDARDVCTYGGALRYSVELLQETYPNIKIVLVTPLPCLLRATESGTLEEYVALEKKIAEEYQIAIIDAYEEAGFDETNLSLYLEDDLHLNADGRRIYGAFLGEKVKELME